jgi:hypothetical protein
MMKLVYLSKNSLMLPLLSQMLTENSLMLQILEKNRNYDISTSWMEYKMRLKDNKTNFVD